MSGKPLRLFVMDVDGTLTDGSICIAADGEIFKSFYVRDGMAIKHHLPAAGIQTAIITGRASKIVASRAKELDVHYVYQDVADKAAVLCDLMNELGLSREQVAYIGDDVNDLPAMALVGWTACPADSAEEVKRVCCHICRANGGRGAVREWADWLIEQKKSNE